MFNTLILLIAIDYFAIFIFIPFLITLNWLRLYYLKTSREIKRIEGLCNLNRADVPALIVENQSLFCLGRSRVFVHATNTSSGIVTIRASQTQTNWLGEFYRHSNHHTKSSFIFITINQWFSMRLELVLTVFLIAFVYIIIFTKSNFEISKFYLKG